MTTMIDTFEFNKQLEKILTDKIHSILKKINISTIIDSRVDEYIKNYISDKDSINPHLIDHSKISWSGFKLKADNIASGTIKNFNSIGIQDSATDVNLTILDGQVIVEEELISKDLEVINTARIKNLEVESITIEENFTIASNSFAKQMENMIDTRIKNHARLNEFNLDGKPLKSNQHYLLDDKSLGPGIVESNLRKVGRLSTLSVTGVTELGETLVVDNGKVGINTDEPSGILSLWDEESELTIRKYKQRTMYIGGARDTNLAIGVNGDAVLTVKPGGIQTNKIKIGDITVSCVRKEPTENGAPGDLAINQSNLDGSPWAWRCMGNNRWLPLK